MRNHIISLVRIGSLIATLGLCAPARADVGQSSIGPSVQIGGGQTNLGIDSRFGVSDNLSVRPFVYFPSNGTDFGTALTYDFHLVNTANNLQITPFVGGAVDINNNNGNSITTASLVGGADLDVSDSVRLKAALVVPLNTDSGQTSALTLGAGLRF
jgi:hypothetical protein